MLGSWNGMRHTYVRDVVCEVNTDVCVDDHDAYHLKNSLGEGYEPSPV
jgi:hypothetical protein